MGRLLVAAACIVAMGAIAHAQSRDDPSPYDPPAESDTQDRPMPSYREGRLPPPPRQGGYEDTINSTDARQDDADASIRTRSSAHSRALQQRATMGPQSYLDAPYEDEAHRRDRLRTADLNRKAQQYAGRSSTPRSADYARQSQDYRRQLAQHQQDLRDYDDARARYASDIARWQARTAACEYGDPYACSTPN